MNTSESNTVFGLGWFDLRFFYWVRSVLSTPKIDVRINFDLWNFQVRDVLKHSRLHEVLMSTQTLTNIDVSVL